MENLHMQPLQNLEWLVDSCTQQENEKCIPTDEDIDSKILYKEQREIFDPQQDWAKEHVKT